MKQWATANPERVIFISMKNRCADPVRVHYNGRGIKVLYKDFDEFFADVGPRPGPEYTIDRIFNDGHYEKGNCRWATKSEQQKNKGPHPKGKDHGRYGTHHSKETKQKMSKSQKGKKHGSMSDEHKRNLGKALKGKVPWNKGKKFNTLNKGGH